jgi:hypothetical protein
MRPVIDDEVPVRRPAALVPPLVDHLSIHRRTHPSLNMLTRRLAHRAGPAHQHLVRRVAVVLRPTQLRNHTSTSYAANFGAINETGCRTNSECPPQGGDDALLDELRTAVSATHDAACRVENQHGCRSLTEPDVTVVRRDKRPLA